MGTVRVNRFNDYWNTSRYFDFGIVRDQMSRDRFIHYSDNADRTNTDRLKKIRMLIDSFNTKMAIMYYLSRELSIDGGTVLWRGRLLFRQYIRGKW